MNLALSASTLPVMLKALYLPMATNSLTRAALLKPTAAPAPQVKLLVAWATLTQQMILFIGSFLMCWILPMLRISLICKAVAQYGIYVRRLHNLLLCNHYSRNTLQLLHVLDKWHLSIKCQMPGQILVGMLRVMMLVQTVCNMTQDLRARHHTELVTMLLVASSVLISLMPLWLVAAKVVRLYTLVQMWLIHQSLIVTANLSLVGHKKFTYQKLLMVIIFLVCLHPLMRALSRVFLFSRPIITVAA